MADNKVILTRPENWDNDPRPADRVVPPVHRPDEGQVMVEKTCCQTAREWKVKGFPRPCPCEQRSKN